MRRVCALILAALLAAGMIPASLASDGTHMSALNAYWALVGEREYMPGDTPSERVLKAVLNGEFDILGDDAGSVARALPLLCAVTKPELARFAGVYRVPVEMLRHAYFGALAKALAAEMRINPADDRQLRNLQLVLELFLNAGLDEGRVPRSERETIRQIITQTEIESFAQLYSLPISFVEFIIMDEDWRNESWEDDADWALEYGWTLESWATEADVRELLGDAYVVTADDIVSALARGYQPADERPASGSAHTQPATSPDDSPDDDTGNEYDDSPDIDIGNEYDDSPDIDVGNDYDDSPDDDAGDDYDDSPDDDSDDYDDSPDYSDTGD